MIFISMDQNISSVVNSVSLWMTQTNTGGQEVVETGLLTPNQLAGYAVTAVWTIINLLVAYLILRHFVFRPIIRLLNKRKEEVESELSDAAEKQKEAKKILSDAEDRIEESKSEAASVISEARVQADRQGLTIVNSAHKEATTIVDRASEDAKRMHNAMLDQMRDEVADLAVSIASKVVGSIIDEVHEKELSRRIMEETLKAEVKKID
jgi:F-type H+-transporting ATPase subunit b